MALVRRMDGNTEANRVTSAWWNTFYDLLTGSMADQPITVANTVKAKRQGSTASGTDLFLMETTVSAAHTYSFYIGPSGDFGIWDGTGGGMVLGGTKDTLTVGGTLQDASGTRYCKVVGGTRITVAPAGSPPASPANGDLWVKR